MNQMKAAVRQRYGSPEAVTLREVPVRQPGPNEVLVRVAAVSLNQSDWEGLTGSPAYARIYGLFRPRAEILGSDIAGTVEAVGEGVRGVQVGDRIFADTLGTFGGFAELALVPAGALQRKPPELSFEEVATLPQAGMIALHGTREILAGQRVLINGGGGGSGTLAIQMAKLRGAHVTAVDRAHKLDLMRAMGADEVLAFETKDFAAGPAVFDFILDLHATRSPWRIARALAPGGTYYLVGGTMGSLLGILLGGPFVPSKKLRVLGVTPTSGDFAELLSLVIDQGIRAPIERTFALREVPEALRHVGEGRALGKILVLPAS